MVFVLVCLFAVRGCSSLSILDWLLYCCGIACMLLELCGLGWWCFACLLL